MEISVDYQHFLLKVFRCQNDGRWMFNPESLSVCAKINDYTNTPLFSLELEVLHYILVHEPFDFPLNSCRECNLSCVGWCCWQPPSLRASEVDYFLNVYGKDYLDFSGHYAFLKKIDGHCYFFDIFSHQCSLHENSKSRICKWHYCKFENKIVNWEEMVAFIRFVLSPEPASQVLVRNHLI
jgi:hypothetical protein